MSIEDKMTIDERRKYLRKMKKRYVEADRKERGRLLDEMEAVTELGRKYLIHLVGGDMKRKPRRQQRGRKYGPEVDDVVRVIDESYGYLCAERVTPNLKWMTQHLVKHDELHVSASTLEKLGQISISTVGRIQGRVRQDTPRPPRKRPRQSKLTKDIPMGRIPWDTLEAGHFEVDLVHHCGNTASGDYVYTLQMIDVLTGWSERAAVLGRSYVVMKDAFQRALARLPFPVLEIHPDNGSEFLNHHMIRFWGEIVQGVSLSRSRPYNKNDNRNVEQKNSTEVRAYLGFERLDTVAQVRATNQLYDKLWVYYNLFQPVMHLVEKKVVLEDGRLSRVIRRHDQARTPFDRLCATDAISPEHRALLETLRAQINPRQLRRETDELIDYIFSLPGAVPGVTENVYQTLFTRPDREDTTLNLAFNRTPIDEQ